MKRLAVFVDGSELGHKAFETALAWKRPADTLLVVHCVQKMTAAALIPLYPPIPIIISENDYKILSETNLALEEAGRLLLDRYRKTVDALEWKNVEYELVVAASIKEAGVDCIQAHKIDTVFVGSHGLGKIRGILMGSFATYVTSFAGCNVMLVRPSPTDVPAPAGTDLGEQTVAAIRTAAADGATAASSSATAARGGAAAGSGLKTVLAAQLEPIRDALDKVLKGLNVIQQRNRPFSMADLQPFQNRLLEVERLGMDEHGVFGGSLKATGFGGSGSSVPAGQAQLSELFHKCHALLTKLTRLAQDAQPSKEEANTAKKSSKKQKAKEKQLQAAKADLKVVMGTALKPVHDELNAILLGLRVLQQKPWHTFDEMRALQDRLRTLEEKDETSAGVFRAHVHEPAGATHIPAGQAMVSDLRQKCHDALEDLTNSARDNFGGLQGLKPVVDPKLVPLLELLQTTRLALRVLAERKPVSAEQLQPIQQSLRDIESDNVVRGVFVAPPATATAAAAGASAAPVVLPGQAILKAALEECYELVESLKQLD